AADEGHGLGAALTARASGRRVPDCRDLRVQRPVLPPAAPAVHRSGVGRGARWIRARPCGRRPARRQHGPGLGPARRGRTDGRGGSGPSSTRPTLTPAPPPPRLPPPTPRPPTHRRATHRSPAAEPRPRPSPEHPPPQPRGAVMTIDHETIRLTRTLSADRASVWAAHADAALRSRWSVPGGEARVIASDDLRAGVSSRYRCASPELLEFVGDIEYVQVAHSRSVVHTETVRTGGEPLSTGLVTWTFTEVPEGTEVCVTAQVASFVGPGHARGDTQRAPHRTRTAGRLPARLSSWLRLCTSARLRAPVRLRASARLCTSARLCASVRLCTSAHLCTFRGLSTALSTVVDK